MNLKHKHDLTEITDFDNKILMYPEIIGLFVIWKKGCIQGAQNFFIDPARPFFEVFPSHI